MARFTSGWFKCWREAARGDLLDNVYLFAIWHWLLHAAHYDESKIIWKGEQRVLPAGSVIFGIKELAVKWDCSQTTIRRWINYLESSERISCERCQRGTLVTIRNWDKYQSYDDGTVQLEANKRSTKCQPSVNQVGLIQELRKKKKEEYSPGFLEIYAGYPRKQGKKEGAAAYVDSVKSVDDRERLLLALKHYVAYCRTLENKKYIKMFSTWMNNWEEWTDPETGSIASMKPKLTVLTGETHEA